MTLENRRNGKVTKTTSTYYQATKETDRDTLSSQYRLFIYNVDTGLVNTKTCNVHEERSEEV